MKKEEENEVIICGEDNFQAFRARLIAALPGFMPVLKAFFDAGLIAGLRGARLEIGNHDVEVHEMVKPKEKHCRDCVYWQRDQIGDGTGLGRCLNNIRSGGLKWPGQIACYEFEEMK